MWPEKRPQTRGRFLFVPPYTWEPMNSPDASLAIFENLTTAVVMLDRDLQVTAINPAGEMMFEASTKKVIGHRFADLFVSSDALLQALRESLASSHPITARGVEVMLPGRRLLTLDCVITPIAHAAEENSALL